MINGIEYSWSKMVIDVEGVKPSGVSSIDYSDKVEMTNNYGAGSEVVSRSYGKYEAEGKIKLHMSELVAIQKASPNGRIQDLAPFNITVTYMKPDGTGTTTDRLKNVQFLNNGRSVKSGDTLIEVEIDLIISAVVWGNK